MMISAAFLDLLRCPITGQKLRMADAEMLAKANGLTSISTPPHEKARSTSNAGTITVALISEDHKMLYPLRHGSPELLTGSVVKL